MIPIPHSIIRTIEGSKVTENTFNVVPQAQRMLLQARFRIFSGVKAMFRICEIWFRFHHIRIDEVQHFLLEPTRLSCSR